MPLVPHVVNSEIADFGFLSDLGINTSDAQISAPSGSQKTERKNVSACKSKNIPTPSKIEYKLEVGEQSSTVGLKEDGSATLRCYVSAQSAHERLGAYGGGDGSDTWIDIQLDSTHAEIFLHLAEHLFQGKV